MNKFKKLYESVMKKDYGYYANIMHDDGDLIVSKKKEADYHEKIGKTGPIVLVAWNDESAYTYDDETEGEIFADKGFLEAFFGVGDHRDDVPDKKEIVKYIENSSVDKDSGSALALLDLKNKKILYSTKTNEVYFR